METNDYLPEVSAYTGSDPESVDNISALIIKELGTPKSKKEIIKSIHGLNKKTVKAKIALLEKLNYISFQDNKRVVTKLGVNALADCIGTNKQEIKNCLKNIYLYPGIQNFEKNNKIKLLKEWNFIKDYNNVNELSELGKLLIEE